MMLRCGSDGGIHNLYGLGHSPDSAAPAIADHLGVPGVGDGPEVEPAPASSWKSRKVLMSVSLG